jgi:hypothetical protein
LRWDGATTSFLNMKSYRPKPQTVLAPPQMDDIKTEQLINEDELEEVKNLFDSNNS